MTQLPNRSNTESHRAKR